MSTPSRKTWAEIVLIAGLLPFAVFAGCDAVENSLGGVSAEERSASKKNLKVLGLAMHDYHDTYVSFPAAVYETQVGDKGIGWTFAVLPFVDHGSLYNFLDSHLAWDHPENMKVYKTQVSGFLNPAIDETADSQGYALIHYSGNEHIMGVNTNMRIRDILDGTSNTIFIGEIAEGFPIWGAPENVRDPAKGINKLNSGGFGQPSGDGVYFLFIDGSAQYLSNDIDPKILSALATPEGGEDMSQFRFPYQTNTEAPETE